MEARIFSQNEGCLVMVVVVCSVMSRVISFSRSSICRSCCSQMAVRLPRASSMMPTRSLVSGSSRMRVCVMVSWDMPDCMRATRESMLMLGDSMRSAGRVMILGISRMMVVSL